MKKLRVNTSNPYDIIIEKGTIRTIGNLVNTIFSGKKICIITDSNVSKLYLDTVLESFRNFQFEVFSFEFDAGESNKTLHTVKNIYDFLAKHYMSRSDLIIALGGGVVGDVAGFAAATYMRGIKYIQVPTTLLSQIDSSVGGKTAVNIEQGKNVVGAFWQPSMVIIDPDSLHSLPSDYFCDGMGEVIKYACIASKPLFDKLNNQNIDECIDDIILECLKIKASIVEQDEHDNGKRMLLNFGHTIGHAIEKALNYNGISHGKAVAIGMAMIMKQCELQGITKSGCYGKLVNILSRYGLPYIIDISMSNIEKSILLDKKNTNGNINIIMIKDIGEGFIVPMSLLQFFEFINGGSKK